MQNLTDTELIELARKDNVLAWDILFKKYRFIVFFYMQKLYHKSVEPEDMLQEGLIGIYKAVNDYDESYNISFKSFASICVKRNMVNFIRQKNRKKHIPMNNYESYYQKIYEKQDSEKGTMFIEILNIKSEDDDPETMLIVKELQQTIKEKLTKALTDIELQIYNLYINGYSYKEIEMLTNYKNKTIDNALQRAKKKMQDIRNDIEALVYI